MADRTVQELGDELPVLAYGYREERFGRFFHRISTERPDGSCLELVSKADALKQIHAITSRLSAAEAKLAEVEKGWRPISDAPELIVNVLALRHDGGMTVAWTNGIAWFNCAGLVPEGAIRAWMPLLEPPALDGGEG